MEKSFFTFSPSATKKLGRVLAKEIGQKNVFSKKAILLALKGELGGGKTTFLQGFAKGLGIKEKILSPTFVIIKKIQIPKTQNPKAGQFYHIDCYRLKNFEELVKLGFKKIISNPQNIVAVEWAEKIQKIMPKNAIWINFDFVNKKKRKITMGLPKFIF